MRAARTLLVYATKTHSARTVRLLAPLAADLAEWRPEECPRTYAHVFEEFDPAERMPAEEAIRAARVPVSSLDTHARMSQ